MAGGVNKAILIGNLGADPEVRYTAGGTPVANFRIATTETWNDKEGQRQERTEWHRIVAWSRLAELCGEYLHKGRQVYIEGKIQTRQWDDREGNKRYTTEIVAQNLTFLGGRPGAGAGAGAGAGGAGAGAGAGGGQEAQRNYSDSKPSQPAASTTTSKDGNYDYGPPPMTDDDVPF